MSKQTDVLRTGQVRVAGLEIHPDDACSRQHCSVQEFSAPDGQVFLPYWLMQNLRVPEGGSVVVTSVLNLPRGVYCRLQPETLDFLDRAADIGPKLLMETALRRYSVLSEGSIIVIKYGNDRYHVRVAELKPAAVVSLCGDVDLETDFMLPEGFDPKRPSKGKLSASCENDNAQFLSSVPSPVNDETITFSSKEQTLVIGYGRRLRDGGYVESVQTVPTGNTTPLNGKISRKMNSLQKVQKIVRDKQLKPISTETVAAIAATMDSSALARQLRSAQRAFSTPGYTLGTDAQAQPLKCSATPVDIDKRTVASNDAPLNNSAVDEIISRFRKCKLCLVDVSLINLDLHTLRCVNNPVYHKFECSICYEQILRIHEKQHRHCSDCNFLCDSNETLANHHHDEHSASCKCTLCHALFTHAELRDHLDNSRCDHTLSLCSLCGLAFKNRDMTQHACMCSSRTERCDECKAYIKIMEFDAHQQQCGAVATQHELVVFKPATLSVIASAEPSLRSKTSSENAVECAYCLQEGFPNIAAVEHHTLHNCRIAKSFNTTGSAGYNQEDPDQPQAARSQEVEEPLGVGITRPLLAQGRMRRKGDSDALRNTSSKMLRLRLTPPNSNNQTSYLAIPRRTLSASLVPSTLLPTTQLANQAGKLRKPKPRPSIQLRSLPKRTAKLIPTSEGPRVISVTDRDVNFGPADLCISRAEGTSQRPFAAPLRSWTNTRTRRRPATNLSPPGRLDQLP